MKHKTLKDWKKAFETKSIGLKQELFKRYCKYYVSQAPHMNFAEATAFRKYGDKIEKELES